DIRINPRAQDLEKFWVGGIPLWGSDPLKPRKAASLSQDHPYAQKVLDSACEKIRTASDGQRHKTRLDQARLVGGYVGAGHLQEGEVEFHLL
mgnify:CR=1